MEIQQRLEVFFRRLAEAPPAANADEVLRLVCRLIEEVEDEFCPLRREEPPPEDFTGRMYAPQSDRTTPFGPDGLAAETRQHRVVCSANGGITIIHKPSDTTVLGKRGKR